MVWRSIRSKIRSVELEEETLEETDLTKIEIRSEELVETLEETVLTEIRKVEVKEETS